MYILLMYLLCQSMVKISYVFLKDRSVTAGNLVVKKSGCVIQCVISASFLVNFQYPHTM